MDRIHLSPPHLSERERELLLDAFDSNWIASAGSHIGAFETEFACKVGAACAVALSSGTAALHLSLVALGIQPGDEVVMSTFTFAATANAIAHVGARPVFVDSNRETWNMDPALLAEELDASAKRGKLPKAVVVVDVYGQCADYEPILDTCRQYDIPVVEDAAQALGATYRDRPAGTLGCLGAYSFNGNKVITAGSGGMLVCSRKEWADRARLLARQAMGSNSHNELSEIGYNYGMSNLLAAIGRGQLRLLDHRVGERRSNYRFYRAILGEMPGIEFMPEYPHGRSTRWLTCITVDADLFGKTAEDLREALEKRNVESRRLWKPVHLHPAFQGHRIRGGAVSETLYEQGLCLPSGSNLIERDRGRVVEAIGEVASG